MRSFLLLVTIGLVGTVTTANAQIILPTNSDFEQPVITNSAHLVVAPSDAGWTFAPAFADSAQAPNEAGISDGGQNEVGADGQVAFLQDISSFSQDVTLDAGVYTLSFSAEGRAPFNEVVAGNAAPTGPNEIEVLLNNQVLYIGTPENTSSFETITTIPIALTSGSYELTFRGLNSGAATNTFVDNMTFVDNVEISTVTPEPSTFALLALGGGALLGIRRRLALSRS